MDPHERLVSLVFHEDTPLDRMHREAVAETRERYPDCEITSVYYHGCANARDMVEVHVNGYPY